MRTSVTRKCVFSLVVLIAACLLIEGCSRVVLGIWQQEPVVPGKLYQYDEHLGWTLRPSQRATSSRTGYEIEYRTNSKGLRDDETSYKKPEGVFRIVLLGDSRTLGFGVPIDKHFSKLIEGYFSKVQVINLGVEGYGVDQQLLRLKAEGLKYRPDLVIAYVAHYGGHRHMHTVRFGKQKPMFESREGELVLINSPVPPPGGSTLHRWLVTHVQTYDILASRTRMVLKLLTSNKEVAGQQRTDEDELKDPGFAEKLATLGEAIIAAMHSAAAEHDAGFVLVTQIDDLHQRMGKRGVPSVNVIRAMKNPTFALPDGLHHINEAGNGVLAWSIVEYLVEQKLVPRQHWRKPVAAGP